ncbi:MAG: hypothetical protein A2087_09470 [Spirochaetes bacterium GWD1_61_31]|nr:MAG: hypothetical protein A2Y37_13720 [Spirochaetes bacterium GWB1_60_80]OHD39266.1 MAG: hypothetical protein A2087_09470 [Spirochaetes bacterium GWD1_61_31]OHD42100.1 MAG: hypothetical protein A2Y35_07565 [Spirochaetes bacterium GWE1_60_18]OHD61644.1 MAG: hypothetical protein A2Y32_00980 [Spirochaetes bacterium GWF1_60_12]
MLTESLQARGFQWKHQFLHQILHFYFFCLLYKQKAAQKNAHRSMFHRIFLQYLNLPILFQALHQRGILDS